VQLAAQETGERRVAGACAVGACRSLRHGLSAAGGSQSCRRVAVERRAVGGTADGRAASSGGHVRWALAAAGRALRRTVCGQRWRNVCSQCLSCKVTPVCVCEFSSRTGKEKIKQGTHLLHCGGGDDPCHSIDDPVCSESGAVPRCVTLMSGPPRRPLHLRETSRRPPAPWRGGWRGGADVDIADQCGVGAARVGGRGTSSE